MAGLLPGDSSSHSKMENGQGGSSHEGEGIGLSCAGWYFSRKDIEENSPSRRDGIELKKEAYLQKSYCTFLQELGMRLKVPQVTIATAIVFCHRLFLRQSHAKNDRRTIATVCMFLAGKVEDTPRELKEVILVSYEIIHKKDPAAAQRIKQKEVYEQQKELILLGERVVLATLGFDLNVHHPYKPLVEAIKKFKVAQSTLAQVAWNFVNDGLRTSLCLQYKPHHIAAGAIFLAAKFLKVKLPSDGEKVWWQEFDVTPRQLEDISNQMLELYEQNCTLQAPPGSEMDRGNGSVTAYHPPAKRVEEATAAKIYAPVAGSAKVSVKQGGAPILSPARSCAEQSSTNNQNGPRKFTTTQSNDCESADTQSGVWDHSMDGEGKDSETFSCRENKMETSRKPKSQSDQVDEDAEVNKKPSTIGTWDWKDEDPLCKFNGANRNSKYSETPKGYHLPDVIVKINKGKLKAALEKRKRLHGGTVKNTDLMDEDDLIESELENGVELGKDEQMKQERNSSSTPSYGQGTENRDYAKEHDGRSFAVVEDQYSWDRMNVRSLDPENGVILDRDPRSDNIEELSSFDDQKSQFPKLDNLNVKSVSTCRKSAGAQRCDFSHPSRDTSGTERAKNTERDLKRYRHERHM